MTDCPDPANAYLSAHSGLLCESYYRLTGMPLIGESPEDTHAAELLYKAPFVQLSHDGSVDPLFTYANLAAQQLFEMNWYEMVGMPSRYSAESVDRDARARLLEQVSRRGIIHDYSGIRVARSGRRFMIKRATVWNMIDAGGTCHGQAAMFNEWEFL